VNKYGGIKLRSERASITNGIGRTNVPFPKLIGKIRLSRGIGNPAGNLLESTVKAIL
jgi:hypothetical protein